MYPDSLPTDSASVRTITLPSFNAALLLFFFLVDFELDFEDFLGAAFFVVFLVTVVFEVLTSTTFSVLVSFLTTFTFSKFLLT